MRILPLAALALALASGQSFAAEHVVTQKGKAFSVKKLTVRDGDKTTVGAFGVQRQWEDWTVLPVV